MNDQYYKINIKSLVLDTTRYLFTQVKQKLDSFHGFIILNINL